jgi:site-specific DNA recombinase
MKAIILARVSTEEQKEAGNSLPSQLLRLQRYAKEKGLAVIRQVSFDESAFRAEREEFSQVVKTLKRAKEPLALCCDKIDRLIRNFSKDLAVLEELRKAGALELHFPSDNIVLHKDSPATDLFRFTIGVSLAKYYSDSISDNVKRAYESKIKRGEWIGKAPVGYINSQDKSGGKNIIEPDPARALFISRMFEMYGTGDYSVKAVRAEMRKVGLTGNSKDPKPLSSGMIYSVLKNPFYYGHMRIKGELYPHRYQPLISKALFDRCQQVMASYHKKPFKYAGKPFVFRGLIRCAHCGCTITGEVTKGHVYYSCTNYKGLHEKRVYVREEELLKPIYEVLRDVKLPDEKIRMITEDLKRTHQAKNHFHEQTLMGLRREYDRIERRINRLFELRIDDPNVTKGMFDRKLKEYKETQGEIEAKMQRYTQADEKFYITANNLLTLAQRAYDIFQSSEVSEKRQLLNFLLQNLQLKGRKLVFTLKTPFDTVLLAGRCSEMLPLLDAFRTVDWTVVKEEMEPFTFLMSQGQSLVSGKTPYLLG